MAFRLVRVYQAESLADIERICFLLPRGSAHDSTFSGCSHIHNGIDALGSDQSDGGGVGSVIAIVNGGIYVTLSNLTVQNGSAIRGGGILNSSGARLTITNCIIYGNEALGPKSGPGLGGGIYNSGPMTVSHSTLSGNFAHSLLDSIGIGGAIWNSGTATVRSSTLSGNTAVGGFGGAIYNYYGGTITVSHSTLSGDSTGFGVSGAGIDNSGILRVDDSTLSGNFGAGVRGSATISNATISGNVVGIIGGTTTIQNSIVANNTFENCSGSITSNGYNLSSDGSCPFAHTGDLNNTDPLLGPLQNNGGPTQTQALLPGSPAIDSGNLGGCTDGQGHLITTDQRGAPRPDKEDTAGCDRGAFERQID